MKEKEVSYLTTKKYYTKGDPLTAICTWYILHGYGQLASYFSSYFSCLENSSYLIFPQAPAKFYLNNDFSRTGASWLTKTNREEETKNNLNYLNQIKEVEASIYAEKPLNLFGFSQGVSMVTRWAASEKILFEKMILWAGGFPEELKPTDFSYLDDQATVFIVAGDIDPLISPERKEKEKEKLEKCFSNIIYVNFKGGHIIDESTLKKIIAS